MPRLRHLQLTGQAQDRGLASHRRTELDPDRQAAVGPSEGHRGRRTAGHVEQRGEWDRIQQPAEVGVPVVDSQTSKYQTIFSRLRRIDDGPVSKPATSTAKSRSGGNSAAKRGNGAKARSAGGSASRRQIKNRKGKKGGTSPFWLLGIASVLVLVGIGAVIALRSIAAMG